jgi:hypothetical protein
MNYFAHALPFLDDPYFAAGTGVPDWLPVIDRQVRVRAKNAAPFAQDADPVVASVAKGVLQHLRDDRRFHETRAFAEISMELSARARRWLEGDPGFRSSFLGHLLAEVLLDSVLLADDPVGAETYYRALAAVDTARIQEIVNRMATRPTQRLAAMISVFCRERILWDYLEDDRLMIRLNQVMRRVGFEPLPDGIRGMLPEARHLILRRRYDLLDGIPTTDQGDTPCVLD